MDEMMKVTILQPFEKRRMLDGNTFLDPNLVMDARHRIFREDVRESSSKAAVLAEARRYQLSINHYVKYTHMFLSLIQKSDHCRLLAQEETREQRLKREQALVERELRKFEQDLKKYRPKCCRPCGKKNMASSSDEDFWKVPSRVKVKFNFDDKRLITFRATRTISLKYCQNTHIRYLRNISHI